MITRSSLILLFAISFTVFIVVPPFLGQPFPPYPSIHWADVFDLLTPLVLVPLYWLLFTDGGSLFSDGRLKVQPLCYDVSTHEMVPHSVFMRPDANSSSWIFYFNNNPLIAGRGHPIVQRALTNATVSLERHVTGELPEIQSTTGPGNLTKSIFEASTEYGQVERWLLVLRDWENVATSKWPLSYRHDERNWRLSNRRGCQ